MYNFGVNHQSFALVMSIMVARKRRKNVIMMRDMNDLHLKRINEYLRKHNIVVFNCNNVKFRINLVVYGFENDIVDLTDEIRNRFYQNNVLRIPKEINLNHLKGDPICNRTKQMTIHYSINNYNFSEIYDEYRASDIVFDTRQ
jgi:hypothetical protein